MMTDREMLDQWIVVELECDEASRLSENTDLDISCAVGFVYVDSMCGMTFNVEAWCNTHGHSLQAVSHPSDTKRRLMFRYDYFEKKPKRLLTPSERTGLGFPEFPDWLSIYYEYEGAQATRALRALTLLDSVRAPGYPDDINCVLVDQTGSKGEESVWAKVIRQEDEGLFLCQLLNEPLQDFGLHKWDRIYVVVSERNTWLASVSVGKPTGMEPG